jgi:hypothetical protein
MESVVHFVNMLYSWANFFNDTVTADHYFHVLHEEFITFLQEIFSIGWAWSYTVTAVLDVLNEHFDESSVELLS